MSEASQTAEASSRSDGREEPLTDLEATSQALQEVLATLHFNAAELGDRLRRIKNAFAVIIEELPCVPEAMQVLMRPLLQKLVPAALAGDAPSLKCRVNGRAAKLLAFFKDWRSATEAAGALSIPLKRVYAVLNDVNHKQRFERRGRWGSYEYRTLE